MDKLKLLIQRLKDDPREADLAEKFLDGLQTAKLGGQFIVVPPYAGAPLIVISYSESLRRQLQPVIDHVQKHGERFNG